VHLNFATILGHYLVNPKPFLRYLPSVVHRQNIITISFVKKCTLYLIKYGKLQLFLSDCCRLACCSRPRLATRRGRGPHLRPLPLPVQRYPASEAAPDLLGRFQHSDRVQLGSQLLPAHHLVLGHVSGRRRRRDAARERQGRCGQLRPRICQPRPGVVDVIKSGFLVADAPANVLLACLSWLFPLLI